MMQQSVKNIIYMHECKIWKGKGEDFGLLYCKCSWSNENLRKNDECDRIHKNFAHASVEECLRSRIGTDFVFE